MKRTSLELPDELLQEVVHLTGRKSTSAAVIVAMQEYVRVAKARGILKLRGSGAWQGDLSLMREDAPPRRRRTK